MAVSKRNTTSDAQALPQDLPGKLNRLIIPISRSKSLVSVLKERFLGSACPGSPEVWDCLDTVEDLLVRVSGEVDDMEFAVRTAMRETAEQTNGRDPASADNAPLSRAELFFLCGAILEYAPVKGAERKAEEVLGIPVDDPGGLEYLEMEAGLSQAQVARLVAKLARLTTNASDR